VTGKPEKVEDIFDRKQWSWRTLDLRRIDDRHPAERLGAKDLTTAPHITLLTSLDVPIPDRDVEMRTLSVIIMLEEVDLRQYTICKWVRVCEFMMVF
jgi:hypothetical protein